MKQPQRLFGLRPRLFDVPAIAFCTIPFAASITNAQGAYDGLSACLEEGFRWGLPYMIGRAYLGTPEGNRQLCLGIAVGGLLYVPFCLFEIRMSPQIMQRVYGMGGGAASYGLRYGGYRPTVFLFSGLELGWWMCCASMSAFMLWRSGNVRRLLGYPMGPLTLILTLVTIACKATGALLQISLGFALILASRRLKTTVLIWALMAIGPFYCVSRPLGLWSGEQFVAWTGTLFGADRAESIGYRFDSEDVLIQSAFQRPFFGWARAGGFNTPDAAGKAAVTDGLWIIVFGWMGFSGLAALNGMLLVPTALFILRFKPQTWFQPAVAPLVSLAIILPLYMIDNLSNAMVNPIYAVAMGALAGAATYRGRGWSEVSSPLGSTTGIAGDRAPLTLPPVPIRAGSPRDQAADRFGQEAVNEAALGLWSSADQRFAEALSARQAALETGRTADRLDRLALTCISYARLLEYMGDHVAASLERERALTAWVEVAASGQLAGRSLIAHAANLNDLAWRLVQKYPSDSNRLDRAVRLAEESLAIDEGSASAWNTLGLARHRRGDHLGAIQALTQSVVRNGSGGNAFDFYYLALANLALGYTGLAGDWIVRAEVWETGHPHWAGDLTAVRDEVIRATSRTKFGSEARAPRENPRGSD